MSTDEQGPDHELMYNAGFHAYFPGSDDEPPRQVHRDPSDWYCACGRWMWPRNKLTGAPHRETATKHWRKHVKEAE